MASEHAEHCQTVLTELVSLMDCEADISLSEDEERINLVLEGPDSGILIGKKGRTLDALQLIVGRISSRKFEGNSTPLSVDAEGYRARREQSLQELADRLYERVMDEGRTVRLNPMTPRDRRVVHLALRDREGVSTESEGEGDDRCVLIIPDDGYND